MYQDNPYKDKSASIKSYKDYVKLFSTSDDFDWDDILQILYSRQCVHDFDGDSEVEETDIAFRLLKEKIKSEAKHEIEPDFPQELIDQGIIEEEDRHHWWWHLVED